MSAPLLSWELLFFLVYTTSAQNCISAVALAAVPNSSLQTNRSACAGKTFPLKAEKIAAPKKKKEKKRLIIWSWCKVTLLPQVFAYLSERLAHHRHKQASPLCESAHIGCSLTVNTMLRLSGTTPDRYNKSQKPLSGRIIGSWNAKEEAC